MDKDIHLAPGIPPDFLGSGFTVALGIGRIVVLLKIEGVGQRGCQFLCPLARAPDALPGWSKNQFGAQRAQ